jgi:hypothetical protein
VGIGIIEVDGGGTAVGIEGLGVVAFEGELVALAEVVAAEIEIGAVALVGESDGAFDGFDFGELVAAVILHDEDADERFAGAHEIGAVFPGLLVEGAWAECRDAVGAAGGVARAAEVAIGEVELMKVGGGGGGILEGGAEGDGFFEGIDGAGGIAGVEEVDAGEAVGAGSCGVEAFAVEELGGGDEVEHGGGGLLVAAGGDEGVDFGESVIERDSEAVVDGGVRDGRGGKTGGGRWGGVWVSGGFRGGTRLGLAEESIEEAHGVFLRDVTASVSYGERESGRFQ